MKSPSSSRTIRTKTLRPLIWKILICIIIGRNVFGRIVLELYHSFAGIGKSLNYQETSLRYHRFSGVLRLK